MGNIFSPQTSSSNLAMSLSGSGFAARRKSSRRFSDASESTRKACLLQPPIHSDSVTSCVAVRPGLVLTAGADKTVILSNYESGEVIRNWHGHVAGITKMAYCAVPGQQFVATGSRDMQLRTWNFSTTESGRVFIGHELVVTGVAILDDEKKVCSGSRDNTLRIWDVETGFAVACKKQSRNVVTHIAYSKAAKYIAQTSEDKELKLWDPRSLEVIHAFPKKSQILSHCDISCDGMYCITSSNGFNSNGCEISIWDVRQKMLMKEFTGHEQSVNCAVYVPNQTGLHQFIVSTSTDHTVRLWDIQENKCVWTEYIPSSGAVLTAAAFNDKSVVIGGHRALLSHLTIVQEYGKTYLSPQSMQMLTG